MKYEKNSTKNQRISITVSEEELTQWRFFNNRESLSAFIREAVQSHINYMDSGKKEDKKLEKRIETNKDRILRIEEDLIEIQMALAKRDIIPEFESNTRIQQFVEDRLLRTDLTLEDRKTFARIRQRLNLN